MLRTHEGMKQRHFTPTDTNHLTRPQSDRPPGRSESNLSKEADRATRESSTAFGCHRSLGSHRACHRVKPCRLKGYSRDFTPQRVIPMESPADNAIPHAIVDEAFLKWSLGEPSEG